MIQNQWGISSSFSDVKIIEMIPVRNFNKSFERLRKMKHCFALNSAHLYLSGPRAKEVADCFVGSPLQSSVISDRIGAASALKMGYAAYTKGTTALLTAILGMVEKEGVRAELAGQWGDAFTDQAVRRVCANTAKAWRFVGEMQEIAATFKGAGLPSGFHEAAADVFERLEEFKDRTEPPAIESVLKTLLRDD
jgi:hypothetical protein